MSETTPLLPASENYSTFLSNIDSSDIQNISIQSLLDEHNKPWNIPHPFHAGLLPAQLVLSKAQSIALLIVVNACILINERPPSLYDHSFSQDGHVRDKEIYAVLGQLFEQWRTELLCDSEYKNSEEVLMTTFKRYDNQSAIIRVIDCLGSTKLSHLLVEHPPILIILRRIWSYSTIEFRSVQWPWARRALRVASAPRAYQALALPFYAVYLTGLVSATISETDVTLFYRIWVLLYSFTSIFNNLSLSSIPFLLAFIRFLSITVWKVRSPPTLLFVALLLHLVQLHSLTTAVIPTPLLLLKPSDTLPLVAFLKRLWSQAFSPATTFFLPLFFVSAALVSSTMQDVIIPPSFISTLTQAAPIETRYFYIFVLCFAFVMIIALSNGLMQTTLLLSNKESNSLEWDCYGTGAGHKARHDFAKAVAYWSLPSSAFPPPFNLLWLAMVTIPGSITSLFGRPHTMDKPGVVLRSILLPFTFIVSAIWLWR